MSFICSPPACAMVLNTSGSVMRGRPPTDFPSNVRRTAGLGIEGIGDRELQNRPPLDAVADVCTGAESYS